MPKLGGSACKHIKKAKYCTSPCTKVHNSRIKHKWYCKQTKKCDKKKRHKKRKTAKRKSPASASSSASSSFF